MGKLTYNLSDFQKAAATFRGELLRLPLQGLDEILPYVTLRPGITYSEYVGTSAFDAQLAPYVKNKTTDGNLEVTLRELKTYFGSVNAEFEPNAEIQTLLGHHAAQALGGGLVNTPQAQEVLANVAKSIGYHLNNALFSGVRKASGTTTADLYDGFDTITKADITAGNIAAGKGNLVAMTEDITKNNAVAKFKEVISAMDVNLRKEDCYMFVPYEILDAYNENYLLTHGATPYNTQYEQIKVEGSNGKITIIPLASKAGTPYIHITPKSNMLIGVDQMSDKERIDIGKYSPDVLTYECRMFFGCQFESVDKRRLMVVQLKSE